MIFPTISFQIDLSKSVIFFNFSNNHVIMVRSIANEAK